MLDTVDPETFLGVDIAIVQFTGSVLEKTLARVLHTGALHTLMLNNPQTLCVVDGIRTEAQIRGFSLHTLEKSYT